MKTFATRPREEGKRSLPCVQCASTLFSPCWELSGFSFVRCRGCGLIQQNPQPLREAVLARYDLSYLEYEEERQFDYTALARLGLADLGFEGLETEFLARAAEGGGKPRVLDIGCATGALLSTFAERGWDCVGVDACEPAIRYGRGRFGLDLRSGVLEDCRFEDASFDLVHASHLIEHLNDPASFLRELARIVAPRGCVVLTTPNSDGFQARLLGSAWRSAIYDHLYLFSRRSLGLMLRDAGMGIEGVATWGGWAAGLRPAFLKRPLDALAKRFAFGDVMAMLCRRLP